MCVFLRFVVRPMRESRIGEWEEAEICALTTLCSGFESPKVGSQWSLQRRSAQGMGLSFSF